MGKMRHEFIQNFDPVISANPEKWRDYLDTFDAGTGNFTFTEYLVKNEYEDYFESGEGVTYVILNKAGISGDGKPDIVGYFVLSSGAIPFISRIFDEDKNDFDEEMWNIPVAEVKMFAVNHIYQDVFWTYDNETIPISALCLRFIVGLAFELIESVIGFKALFLHSVPNAEKFYIKNGFSEIEKNMFPFDGVDADFKPLWMPLTEVRMTYEE